MVATKNNLFTTHQMDLRSILQAAKIPETETKQYDFTLTNEKPFQLDLKNIEDLIKICEFFNLPIPTQEMFENEAHIEHLLTFLTDLRESLLKYDLQLSEINIKQDDLDRTKQIESHIDNMEIEIAHMEDEYRALHNFKYEILKFHNKDTTITDLISTSATSDIKNNNISNVFADNNEHYGANKMLNQNTTQLLTENLIFSYIKTLETSLENLKSDPHIRHRNSLIDNKLENFFHHKSYKAYKNMKKKHELMKKIGESSESFQKSFFLELIEHKTLYLSDIEKKYNIDRVEIFKLVYYLESKKILIFDNSAERVMLFRDGMY